MTEPTTPQLAEAQIAEIEARANAASKSYCVDWEEGNHALLQAGGWRPASEEQPRTIATFDKNDGYLDLLFCAEARTDIPALIRDWRTLRRLVDIQGRESDSDLTTIKKVLAENAGLRERLAQAENERINSDGSNLGNLLCRLLLCALVAFVTILAVYAVNGGSIFNRLGYATFMGLLPGAIALLIFKLARLKDSGLAIAIVYSILFVLVQVIFYVIR